MLLLTLLLSPLSLRQGKLHWRLRVIGYLLILFIFFVNLIVLLITAIAEVNMLYSFINFLFESHNVTTFHSYKLHNCILLSTL